MYLNKILNKQFAIPSRIHKGKLMFYIVIIDILFLPYIRVFSASLSMLLLPIWFLFNLKKFKMTRENLALGTLIFLSLSSLLISYFTLPFSMVTSNIVNTIILLYGILYYLFFKYIFVKFDFNINSLLTKYLFFTFILALIYFLNPSTYFNVRTMWSMSGQTIAVTDSLSISRFTSILSDPNNAAVVSSGVMAFLLFRKNDSSPFKNIFIMMITLFIVTATMSTTGFITFSVVIAFYGLTKFKLSKSIKIKKKNVFFFFILLFLLPLFIYTIYSFFESEVAQIALTRVSNNSADSRFDIWKTLLTNENPLKYLLTGSGGNVFVNGLPFRPHNGHLHLIYSYGWIVYGIFMFIYFRKRPNTTWKDYFFLVPFLLGFTVNVGIYEPRFINLLSLLTANYAAYSFKKRAFL